MHGDHIVLIGLAAVGSLDPLCAGAWPDVLALMAKAARTVADKEVAMLAKIVAPGVGIVAAPTLVFDECHVIDAAAVGDGMALPSQIDTAGLVAVAPVHE